MIDYGLILLTGVLSSAHCIGMCGAVVLAYSMQPAVVRTPSWLLHAAYNGGRILSYALLGAMVGFAGMMVAPIEHLGEGIAIVGGAVMIVAGMSMLGLLPFGSTVSLGGNGMFLRRLHGRLLANPTVASKMSLGALTPLLPCGVLYGMVAKAAVTGSMTEGAVTMALFGAGMAPGLLVLGGLSSVLSARWRDYAGRTAAVAMILMGVVLLLRGFHVPFLSFIPVGVTGEHSCCTE
jgi:hypothetical protein